MVAETIYSIAFSHLSEADKLAMQTYQTEALKIQRQGTDDPTASIEGVLKQVPGARRALKHYDREVGRLMRARP